MMRNWGQGYPRPQLLYFEFIGLYPGRGHLRFRYLPNLVGKAGLVVFITLELQMCD